MVISYHLFAWQTVMLSICLSVCLCLFAVRSFSYSPEKVEKLEISIDGAHVRSVTLVPFVLAAYLWG